MGFLPVILMGVYRCSFHRRIHLDLYRELWPTTLMTWKLLVFMYWLRGSNNKSENSENWNWHSFQWKLTVKVVLCLSCLVLSCLVCTCVALSCLALSCLVLSPCLMASLSFGIFVFWPICLLVSLSFGLFVFWWAPVRGTVRAVPQYRYQYRKIVDCALRVLNMVGI